MIERLNLGNAKVLYNELNINLKKPLSEQIWELNEDLLQLSVGSNIIVDVGYYPSHSLNGRFKVMVIEEGNWENPLITTLCDKPDLLVDCIQEVLNKVKDN